jgi:putative effector of murein hydrolase
MGVATDGIATARAFKESEVGSSFAWLGMAINTIVNPLLLPRVVRLYSFA